MTTQTITRRPRAVLRHKARTLDAAVSQTTLAGPRTGIATRTTPAGQSVVINYPMPGATGLDYSAKNLLRVQRTHEIVNACVRVRADGLVAPRLVVERRQSDGSYQAEDEHPLIGLFRVPGPTIDTATLWRCMSVSWDATGLVFLEPLITPDGTLGGVNPLNPSEIYPHRDQSGMLDYYEWWPGYGQRVRMELDELIIRRTVGWADAPPLMTALAAVDADQSMTEYVRSFFQNAGIPSGILSVQGSGGKDQADEIQERWIAKYGRYGTHQGAPSVLFDGTTYQKMGASMEELESETMRAIAESRIAMLFGVPPLIIYSYVGLLRATYSNLKEAWAGFWDSTMSPLLVEWSGWLTRSLLIYYESQSDIELGLVRVTFDKRGVGPYVEDEEAKVERLRVGLSAGAVTVNEYRAAAGLESRADGDVYLRNMTTQAPVEAVKQSAILDRRIKARLDALGMTQSDETGKQVAHNVKGAPKPTPRLDNDVKKYLSDQYAKGRRLVISEGPAGAQVALETELDNGTQLFGTLAPAERKAYAEGWKQAALKIDWDVVLDTGDVTSAVDVLAERCVGIAGTTRQEIADLIIQGSTEQWTDAEIAQKIGELGFTRSKERAPIITANELRFAANTASLDAFTASGIVSEIEWITAGSDVCDICKPLDGVRVPLGEAFPGGIAPADGHVNCRCDILPIVASTVEIPA